MNYNTKLNDLRTNIINLIGQSELPVGMVYYMFKDLINELNDAYNQSIIIEQQVEQLTKNTDDEEEDGHQE